MRVIFFDSNNNVISTLDVATCETQFGSWQQYGGRFTTPANTANMKIDLYSYMTSGWVAFDDVSLVQVGD